MTFFMWKGLFSKFKIDIDHIFPGCHDVIPADSKYLSPVARYWIKGTSFETTENVISINLKERNNLDVRNNVESSGKGNSAV